MSGLLKLLLNLVALGSVLYWLFWGRKRWENTTAGFLKQFAEMFLENVTIANINPSGIQEVKEVVGYLGSDLVRLRQLPGTKHSPTQMVITKTSTIAFPFTIFRRQSWWKFGLANPLLLDTREIEIGLDKKFRIFVDAASPGSFTEEQRAALRELTSIPQLMMVKNDSVDGFCIYLHGYVLGGQEPARIASRSLKKALGKV